MNSEEAGPPKIPHAHVPATDTNIRIPTLSIGKRYLVSSHKAARCD